MNINETSGAIIGAAMKVHSALGPGLLERAYQVCLKQELTTRGFKVLSELAMPIVWEGVKVILGIAWIC